MDLCGHEKWNLERDDFGSSLLRGSAGRTKTLGDATNIRSFSEVKLKKIFFFSISWSGILCLRSNTQKACMRFADVLKNRGLASKSVALGSRVCPGGKCVVVGRVFVGRIASYTLDPCIGQEQCNIALLTK